MDSRALVAWSAALVVALAGCRKSEPSPVSSSSASIATAPPASASSSASRVASVVAESLPRCRTEGSRLAIPGDEVVAGDAVTTADSVVLGVIRREGSRRLASLVRASLDLTSIKLIEVGAALGDDPPPAPRVHAGAVFVSSFARGRAGADADAGAALSPKAATRLLEIARVDGDALAREGRVVQQADESLAHDVAWPPQGAGAPLVAWDEDAPLAAGQMLADRGVVKVQLLGGAKARVASPDTTDAEAPRLLARRGGYWLAWLARRAEATEDAGAALEGPAERRAFRWVEIVALDAKGEPASAVRRVTSHAGRVASFELAQGAPEGGGEPRVIVLVQDEAAPSEGAGERIVRYALDGQSERIEASEVLDGGVGSALADLLPASHEPPVARWLAFTDTLDHAHLVALGPSLTAAGAATAEPSLDGARVVASGPGPDVVYAVGSAGAADAAGGRIELRRLVCR